MSAAAPSLAGPAQTSSQELGPQAVVVFEDVQVDAVLVRELRPRVGAGAGEDAGRVAEPVAERVEVVDAHDPQRDPPLALLHGIQCGMARMSIVASTGSPRSRRLSRSLQARTDWSNRMFWLTASVTPARRQSVHDLLRLTRSPRRAASARGCRGPACASALPGSPRTARPAAPRRRPLRRAGRPAAPGTSSYARSTPRLSATAPRPIDVPRGDRDGVEPGLLVRDEVAVAMMNPAPMQPMPIRRLAALRGRRGDNPASARRRASTFVYPGVLVSRLPWEFADRG